MKVYIIIEARGEDYHGTYETIMSVHETKEKAETEKDKLAESNFKYNIGYYISEYSVL